MKGSGFLSVVLCLFLGALPQVCPAEENPVHANIPRNPGPPPRNHEKPCNASELLDLEFGPVGYYLMPKAGERIHMAVLNIRMTADRGALPEGCPDPDGFLLEITARTKDGAQFFSTERTYRPHTKTVFKKKKRRVPGSERHEADFQWGVTRLETVEISFPYREVVINGKPVKEPSAREMDICVKAWYSSGTSEKSAGARHFCLDLAKEISLGN